jgi:hypothetical protein
MNRNHIRELQSGTAIAERSRTDGILRRIVGSISWLRSSVVGAEQTNIMARKVVTTVSSSYH